ncbi:hypothetical protein [Streptomyces sp. NPDC046909]
MVLATVREWRDEDGWGVLDSPETPGFKQDGYDYRAVKIVPRPV